MKYEDFLLNKAVVDIFTGISSGHDISSTLYDFQRDITIWALKRGRAAIFADCGLYKTGMQLEWAKNIPGNVLIFAPLAVAQQTVRIAKNNLGLTVSYCRKQEDIKDKITITNYEMINNFDASFFSGIVLDECFPPDAPIEVFNSDKFLELKYIKDIRIGDKILNASGEDYVKQTYKRRINRAVYISAGSEITCSENHPFFTLHGWKCAQDLRPGDYIMETKTAVHMVRNCFQSEICSTENAAFLREILLSEMENEYPGAQGESSHSGDSCTNRDEKECVVQEWKSDSNKRIRAHKKIKTNAESRDKNESFTYLAEDEAQTFRAWGEWSRFDGPADDFIGCSWRQLDSGIFFITGPTNSGLSDRLQAGLSKSRKENKHRSRWSITLQQKIEGCKTGYKVGFIRVDSVEILEQGHPKLEKYRDANGHIYFYDIKAKRHPSFSLNGLLVHNSSILKSFTGSFRNTIIEKFKKTPFRLACTATPAPNDYMELGNHSEFLGVMTRTEMLSMFFIHDGGDTAKWRLKGHAQDNYWKWLCSWAVMLRKPSDLGYEDNGFILPPLNILQQEVETPSDGFSLFTKEAQTLQERITARRDSIPQKVAMACDLVTKKTLPLIIKKTIINLCGNKNTKITDEQKKETIQNTLNVLKSNGQELMPNEKAITRHITKTTKKNIKDTETSIEITEMREGGKDMPPMRYIESNKRQKPENIQPVRIENIPDLNCHSELESLNTMNSLKSNMESARFADGQNQITEDISSQLTTATIQAELEGSCVQDATWASANLKTISDFLKEQYPISEKWVIGVNLNKEQDLLERILGDQCISVYGSLSPEEKANRILEWIESDIPILLAKSEMIAYGLNFQHCHNMILFPDDSYEKFYQFLRRCWRFGQTKPVNCHIIMADTEGAVVSNIKRKEKDAMNMVDNMVKHMHVYNEENIKGLERDKVEYKPMQRMILPQWIIDIPMSVY